MSHKTYIKHMALLLKNLSSAVGSSTMPLGKVTENIFFSPIVLGNVEPNYLSKPFVLSPLPFKKFKMGLTLWHSG